MLLKKGIFNLFSLLKHWKAIFVRLSVIGPPGFGKSTTAQLLSREHGYVYYEGDCFTGLRNPYIPADVENPSMAQMRQRMLVGEGMEERREVCYKGIKQWEVHNLSTTCYQ